MPDSQNKKNGSGKNGSLKNGSGKNGSRKNGKFESKGSSRSEQILLKQIGLLVHRVLFEKEKPVEWLSFKSGIARSSIREIIAGRSNTRILTLNSIARGLGFDDVIGMLEKVRGKNSNKES
ncbi:MAG: hypothetical protein KGP28_00940 [Bdellovibrionales bacterium]|nr:hypothetical protein [Bdellovibrionales bacterium]